MDWSHSRRDTAAPTTLWLPGKACRRFLELQRCQYLVRVTLPAAFRFAVTEPRTGMLCLVTVVSVSVSSLKLKIAIFFPGAAKAGTTLMTNMFAGHLTNELSWVLMR